MSPNYNKNTSSRYYILLITLGFAFTGFMIAMLVSFILVFTTIVTLPLISLLIGFLGTVSFGLIGYVVGKMTDTRNTEQMLSGRMKRRAGGDDELSEEPFFGVSCLHQSQQPHSGKDTPFLANIDIDLTLENTKEPLLDDLDHLNLESITAIN